MRSPHIYAADPRSVATALPVDAVAHETRGGAGDHRLRSLVRMAKEKVRLYTIGTAISIAPEDVQLKANAEVSRIVHAKDNERQQLLDAVQSIGRVAVSGNSQGQTASEFPALCAVLASTNAIVGEERQALDEDMQLEDYHPRVTKALYEAFYTDKYLSCSCPDREKHVLLLERYRCALQLRVQLRTPGDDSHLFFDSMIQPKEQAARWTAVQFQLPRNHRVAFVEPAESDERSSTLLNDFCQVFREGVRYAGVPVRIEGQPPNHEVHTDFSRLVDTRLFEDDREPVRLVAALTNGELSAKSQIFLAFALAKSCWQFYETEWMNAEWDVDTICLSQMSPDNVYDNNPNVALHLRKINSDEIRQPEFLPRIRNSSDNIHPFPHILRLGTLLVLLCSRNPEGMIAELRTLNKRGEICLLCYKEMTNRSRMWPLLDVVPRYKDVYKRIVQQCFGSPFVMTPIFSDTTLDAAGRRSILREKVVLPLYSLLRDMTDENSTIDENDRHYEAQTETRGHRDASNTTGDVNSYSRDWMKKLRHSWLQNYLSKAMSEGALNRPKIALIDTGFDAGSMFLTSKHRKRLRHPHQRYNWKDCLKESKEPIDEDGHGTSMLSLLLDVAPFADICVARIAANSKDLGLDPPKTGSYLAEAIRWSVETQHAEIVVMALGWQKEPLFQRVPVVRNAITDMLTKSDQNVLFFAAASNSGSASDDMFPANLANVFSIRGTNAEGIHRDYNASLPVDGRTIFGTLGEGVPVHCRGPYSIVGMNGASPATAIAAGLAATVTAYRSVYGADRSWAEIGTPQGFRRFLLNNMKKSAEQKRFFTLQEFYEEGDQRAFRAALDRAS